MMRVSIKSYLHAWVQEVGQQMGCQDATEVVNHLLREHKRAMAQQLTVTTAATASKPQASNDLTDVLSSEFEF